MQSKTLLVTVSSITINKLKFGQSSIASDPKSGLLLSVNKSSLSASADYQIALEQSSKAFSLLSLITSSSFAVNGSLNASADGVVLKVDMFVSADDKGHPQFNLSSCYFRLDDLKVKVAGDGRLVTTVIEVINQLNAHNETVLQPLH